MTKPKSHTRKQERSPIIEPCTRFFGRRTGRSLSLAQQRALDHVLPCVLLTPDTIDSTLNTWISASPAPIWMEIGFGTGEHLLAQLMANPSVRYIGVEVFRNGLAQFVHTLPPELYPRVCIYPKPVQDLLPHLPAHCLEGIFVLFPDPWPKSGHGKRRLVQEDFLDSVARILKPGAELRIASDSTALIKFMLNALQASPHFTWQEGVKTPDEASWPPWPLEGWPLTRYAQKSLSKGQKNAFMIWKRNRECLL